MFTETQVRSRLNTSAWVIECGLPGCGHALADIAWVDINFNIATNAPVNVSQNESFGELPAPHLRRYRMAVMFSEEWTWRRGSRQWTCEGGKSLRRRRVPPASRVVRGSWSVAELGQQGVPPFDLVCPRCGSVQFVEAERRTGVPGPPKAELAAG